MSILRNRGVISCLLFVFLIPTSRLVAGDSPAKSFQTPIEARVIQSHIEYLASPQLRGRRGDDAQIAADYIVTHFKKSGLKPLFKAGDYYQDIPGSKLLQEKGGEQRRINTIIGRNVGAVLPGSDPKLKNEYIIISAHFDHLGTSAGKVFAGADDNASGVAMMLEVSRYLARQDARPKRSIVFVGFDLEERMLWGSRWFAANPPWPIDRVKLFITADMIGRSLGSLDLPTVFVMGSEHAPRLNNTLDDAGAPEGMDVSRLGIDLIGTRSDYGPFRDRKIPFLFFSTGQHVDYHTPRDTPERVDNEKVAKVSGLILQVAIRTANQVETPVWKDDPASNMVEVETLNRLATLLLEHREDHKLGGAQLLLVSHAKLRTEKIMQRGEVTAGERQWLIRIAQLMLLSVF